MRLPHVFENLDCTIIKPSMLSVAVLSSLLLIGCEEIDKFTGKGTGLGDQTSVTENSKTDTDAKPTTEPAQPTTEPVEKKSQLKKSTFVKSFTADSLDELSSPELKITGKPTCDVEVKKITYETQGAAGEIVTATSALMIPVGSEQCSEPRSILLYAHGTAVSQDYDLTQVATGNSASTQALALARNFAAHGYVVIAPNYAGYDESTLTYHPYLNKKQQSIDMYDALHASKEALKDTPSLTLSDKLFISGYSQGGFVAMAAAQYLQQKGEKITAVAPLSGPYSLLAFGDEIFNGKVNQGATIFSPLLAINYQKQYKNIYNTPADILTEKYANLTEDMLPSRADWGSFFQKNIVPYSELFQSNTGNAELDKISPPSLLYGYGFSDTDYLIRTDYRLDYLKDVKSNPDGLFANDGKASDYLPAKNPQHPFRQALKDNDMRDYLPKGLPILLCGGNQDPMVFFDVNTTAMGDVWNADQASDQLDVTILDIDNTNARGRKGKQTLRYIGKAQNNQRNMNEISRNIQQEFASQAKELKKQGIDHAIANGASTYEAQIAGYTNLLMNYHSGLATSSCGSAASKYFAQF